MEGGRYVKREWVEIKRKTGGEKEDDRERDRGGKKEAKEDKGGRINGRWIKN